MQQMAVASYEKKAPKTIAGFKLLAETPSLKFYNSGKLIVVAVRGTDDFRDFSAWHLVALGQLNKSARFQEDLTEILAFQAIYPKTEYKYIAVGHSLGGAIIDRFLRMGLIQNALSYNPAPEPQELKGNTKHRRIYHEDDPLYKIAGRFIPGIEVRKSKDPFLIKMVRTAIPLNIANAYNAITKHKLPTFEGGATRREEFIKDLRANRGGMGQIFFRGSKETAKVTPESQEEGKEEEVAEEEGKEEEVAEEEGAEEEGAEEEEENADFYNVINTWKEFMDVVDDAPEEIKKEFADIMMSHATATSLMAYWKHKRSSRRLKEAKDLRKEVRATVRDLKERNPMMAKVIDSVLGQIKRKVISRMKYYGFIPRPPPVIGIQM